MRNKIQSQEKENIVWGKVWLIKEVWRTNWGYYNILKIGFHYCDQNEYS